MPTPGVRRDFSVSVGYFWFAGIYLLQVRNGADMLNYCQAMKLLHHAVSVLLTTLSLTSISCNKFPDDFGQGSLSWNFNDDILTKGLSEIPDTDAFVLQVRNSAGTILYEGDYGGSPETLLLDPGSYSVKVVSRRFDSPEFSAPQFGDEQVVVVQPGGSTHVALRCTQLNSGLRLRVSPDFGEVYPSGFLSVSSSGGTLKYQRTEDRIGYFNPGAVEIFLNDGKESSLLTSRYLDPCEILTLGINCPTSDRTDVPMFSISVDTTRIWNEEFYTIGSDDGTYLGSSPTTAYGVNLAKEHAGETEVWVCGYIVGGDLTSTKAGISFTPPFESVTNIAIAARSSAADKSSCMSVQLPSGKFRDELNLVDHPSLIGTKICIKGDIVSAYYNIPGIRNITEYSIFN